MHIKLSNLKDLGGFVAENAGPGGMVPVLSRAALTSVDTDFDRYVEQLTSMLLVPAGVFVNQIHQFLAVLHQDGTGDLFVNDFTVELEIRTKRDIRKGQVVTQGQIADIRQVRFPGVTLKETDKLVYVFKVGWRFGLVFDFGAAGSAAKNPPASSTPLDVDGIQTLIGDLYRYLSFFGVYQLLEVDTKRFDEMQSDGWFPFVETLPSDFKDIAKAYEDKFDFDNKINKVLSRFDEKRIREISDRWWRNEQFAAKRNLIEAGINAYLQDTPDGYVNCIKNLFSEVEGLLRSIYRIDTGQGRMTTRQFLHHLGEKAKSAAGSEYSLLLARPFLEYMETQAFRNFDVEKDDVPLSRHSSSHGEAASSLYTKARALQVILVLDQLHFYD